MDTMNTDAFFDRWPKVAFYFLGLIAFSVFKDTGSCFGQDMETIQERIDHIENDYYTARSEFNSGNVEKAIQTFEMASHQYSDIEKLIPGMDLSDGSRNQLIKRIVAARAACYIDMGVVFTKIGKFEPAIGILNKARNELEGIPNTDREKAVVYNYLGAVLGEMKQYDEAMDHVKQALRIFENIPDAGKETADCYSSLGTICVKSGQYKTAVTHLKRAIDTLKPIPGTFMEQVACYNNLGISLRNLYHYDEAITCYHNALELYAVIPETGKEQAQCIMNIGAALWALGHFEQAKDTLENALRQLEGFEGTDLIRADCLKNLGVVTRNLWLPEEALVKYEDALNIYLKYEDMEEELADVFLNRGVVYSFLGNQEQAISNYSRALDVFESKKDTEKRRAYCLVNIGFDHSRSGDYLEASDQFSKALEYYRKLEGTELNQANCLLNIGHMLRELGRCGESVQTFEKAMGLYGELPVTEDKIYQCWGGIGNAYLRSKQYENAIEAYQKVPPLPDIWWIYHGLGNAFYLRGREQDDHRAIENFLLSIESTELIRESIVAAEYRTSIFEEPFMVYPDFVKILVQYAKRGVKSNAYDVSRWMDDPSTPDALLEAAFHYADRGKGRVLIDVLKQKAQLKNNPPKIELLNEEKTISLRISQLTRLREGLPLDEMDRRKKLTRDIEDLQQRLNINELKIKNSTIGDYIRPDFRKPMDVARELSSDMAILQYSIGEKDGRLMILTKNAISAYPMDCSVPALPTLLSHQEAKTGEIVDVYRQCPDSVGLDGLVRLSRLRVEDLGKRATEQSNLMNAMDERKILERLGEAVLPEPALSELQDKGIKKLLIIPDGSLYYIPFGILRLSDPRNGGKHFLIEEFAVSCVPSISTLDAIREQAGEREKDRLTKRKSLLAFANPDFGEGGKTSDDMMTRMRRVRSSYYHDSGLSLMPLPYSGVEAKRVAALFKPDGTVVCAGKLATEDRVKALMDNSWKYLLFSTHGLMDMDNGMLSCLVLSSVDGEHANDGFLQAQEVMRMDLDADLVMLSACETGLGKMSRGEGLVGLCTAFFYAGAKSVCSSLWKVPDGPTVQLVSEFFKNIEQKNMDKSSALQTAMLSVMKEGVSPDGHSIDYSSPFCWGAFVLVGDPY